MTQQLINVGIAPDDGTGDPDRIAFQKTNDNFAENYASIATAVANDATHTAQITALGLGTSVSYNNAASGLTATTLQAAIDEILAQRINTAVLLSSRYGLVADGVVGVGGTDNTAAILAWIAAGQALIDAGRSVEYRWVPGLYAAIGTGGGFRFPGEADLIMTGATLIATGSNLTYPRLTHGNFGASTKGNSIGIAVIGNAVSGGGVGARYLDRNFIGFRALNRRYVCRVDVLQSNYFSIGFQLASDSIVEACNITIGSVDNNKTPVEFCSLSPDTAYVSENMMTGGSVNPGSALAGSGTVFGLTIATEYDTGYHGNSGNVWDKAEFQVGFPAAGYTWGATSSTNQVAGNMFYMALSGMEYMVKTPGTTGTVEPSIIPSIAAGTRVDLVNCTTVAGSQDVTVSSTAGISAGWHSRGTSPLSNFPFDTYVDTVTDGTHLKMSKPAMKDSSLYRMWLTAPITDNSTVWIYVGPYRRGILWHRDNGNETQIRISRSETATGETFCVSGPYLWPPFSSVTPSAIADITLDGVSIQTVKDARDAVWTAGDTTLVTGDRRRPTVLSTVYWECLVGGTTGGAEPTPGSTPLTTFTDNTVTWIIRTLRDTATFGGGYGNYTGKAIQPLVSVRRAVGGYSAANDQTQPNVHLRAVGSATGWDVPGYFKLNGSTTTRSFAATDFTLARDGLLVNLNSGPGIGFLINTEKQKLFRINKHLGFYTKNRGQLVSFDKSYLKTDTRSTQVESVARITSGVMAISGTVLADGNDNLIGPSNFIVADNVPYVFFGIGRGSTGTPVALTLKGLSVTALPMNASEAEPFQAECLTPFGTTEDPRSSPGTPTSGFFKKVGEYIQNSSYISGATPRGWFVKTAGWLFPAWAGGATVVRGQGVSAAGNAYCSNGSFVTGTTPGGALQNAVDGTASGIVSGDVATWDYMGVLAVLDPDIDSETLYSAGNAGAAPVPNCQNGLRQQWTQSANMTVGAPTNAPAIGEELTLLFTSNGVWTTLWNATYRDAPAWVASANNQKATARFTYDGTGYQFVGGSTAFA